MHVEICQDGRSEEVNVQKTMTLKIKKNHYNARLLRGYGAFF